MGRAAAWALLCLLLLSLGGCTMGDGQETVYSFIEDHTAYPAVLAQMLPIHAREKSNRVFESLQSGVAEAFDVQALPALEGGVAAYWYPHYLSTVVIAVDRDRTETAIRGWRDLLSANETVGYAGLYPSEVQLAAVACGLEGEDFNLRGAADFLTKLRAVGHFDRSFDPAILICYDHQAVALKQAGRNLEIIVPEE